MEKKKSNQHHHPKRGNPNIRATSRKLTRENQRAWLTVETTAAHPRRRLFQRENTLT